MAGNYGITAWAVNEADEVVSSVATLWLHCPISSSPSPPSSSRPGNGLAPARDRANKVWERSPARSGRLAVRSIGLGGRGTHPAWPQASGPAAEGSPGMQPRRSPRKTPFPRPLAGIVAEQLQPYALGGTEADGKRSVVIALVRSLQCDTEPANHRNRVSHRCIPLEGPCYAPTFHINSGQCFQYKLTAL